MPHDMLSKMKFSNYAGPPDENGSSLSKRSITRRNILAAAALSIFAPGLNVSRAFAGDSIYGKVTQIKAPNLVVLDYGAGQYDIRIAGIDAPSQASVATKATALLSSLVLNKNARMRLVEREAGEKKELLARLSTDDPMIGIKDVGIELVRAGLARKQPAFDYKYGELAAAESEARSAKRGLWSTQ
jgi:endonuclease YncB( thermonuclease family)